MPLPSQLVLKDAAAADIIFTKVDSVHGLVVYQHRIDGRPDLARQITITNPKNSNGRKGEVNLTNPVVREVAGVLTRVNTVRVKIQLSIVDEASTADRLTTTEMLESLTATSAVAEVFSLAIGAQ